MNEDSNVNSYYVFVLFIGKGLGRNETGIQEALKPKLKFDNRGIGHDASEQFTYHWWENAFNNAANNIQVSTTEVSIFDPIFVLALALK